MSQTSCIFCAIIEGSIPAEIVLQNDNLIVIKDIAPRTPIHYLIIPKKHVVDIASLSYEDEQNAGALLLAAKQLASQLSGSQAFRLLINNGADAGQKVFHLHVHFLANQIMTDF